MYAETMQWTLPLPIELVGRIAADDVQIVANVAQLSKACRALLRPKLLLLKPKWRFEQLTKDQYSEWDEWGEDKGLSIMKSILAQVLSLKSHGMKWIYSFELLCSFVLAVNKASIVCVFEQFPDQQVMVQRVFDRFRNMANDVFSGQFEDPRLFAETDLKPRDVYSMRQSSRNSRYRLEIRSAESKKTLRTCFPCHEKLPFQQNTIEYFLESLLEYIADDEFKSVEYLIEYITMTTIPKFRNLSKSKEFVMV